MERYRAVPKGGTIIHQVRHGLSAGTAGHGLGPGPARRALKMSAPTRYDEMQSESRWRFPHQLRGLVLKWHVVRGPYVPLQIPICQCAYENR